MASKMRPRRPPPVKKGDAEERPAFTVASLVRLVRARLETEYPDLWVEGELADLARPRSGHLYFTLRDESGDVALRATMWAPSVRKLSFEPADGMKVRARGSLTIYEPRGGFQLRAIQLERVGEGDLRRRFEQVKARLEARGLLEPLRKRALPWTPRRVGIVTSRDSAALRDVLKVLGDRVPVPVLISHASVQGEVAPGEIVVALSRLARVPDVEVVIVGRGGGSGDDLWAWNDEAVALAIAEYPVPVITAIGHQTDVTIADLVADVRAATPTEAAMLAVPEPETLRHALQDLSTRLVTSFTRGLDQRSARVEELARRLPAPEQLLSPRQQRLDELNELLEELTTGQTRAMGRHLHTLELRLARLQPREEVEHRRVELATLNGRLRRVTELSLERSRTRLGCGIAALDELSPLGTLGRGYGLVKRSGEETPLTSADAVSPGDAVELRLRQGELDCLVRKVRPTSVED